MVAKDQTEQSRQLIDISALWIPLAVAGPDSKAFLSAQLASNVDRLEPGRFQLAAYLNPKGRVFAIMALCPIDDGFLALVNPGIAQQLMQRLRMFVLRSKVTIEPKALAVAGQQAPPNGPAIWTCESRDDVLTMGWPGERQILVGPVAGADSGNPEKWLAADCRLGLCHLFETTLETFIPQQLNLDVWGAVSLRKGCYPGQEIVARMHYLGRNKRHLYRAKAQQSLMPGATVATSDGRAAGQIVQCAGDSRGFITLAALHESMSEADLTVDGVALNAVERVERNGDWLP